MSPISTCATVVSIPHSLLTETQLSPKVTIKIDNSFPCRRGPPTNTTVDCVNNQITIMSAHLNSDGMGRGKHGTIGQIGKRGPVEFQRITRRQLIQATKH